VQNDEEDLSDDQVKPIIYFDTGDLVGQKHFDERR
jgi:hypothetical protein